MENNTNIKSICVEKNYGKRKNIKKIEQDWIERKNQLLYINQLFLEENLDKPHMYIKNEINKKINSYINQDKSKNIHSNTSYINYNDILVKLVESKLKCKYCNNEINIIYCNKLQQDQWTLDRVDNYKGHNNENTIISCLKCNIQRGRINNKKFMFTKQLTIKKSN
tara:strand:- start:79 stop:576 length:498 start_codon:yes stop_codon:yes gene_type:complete